MKDDLLLDGSFVVQNDPEQQCIKILSRHQLGMQVYKVTNIGFAYPQRFILELQKDENLSKREKTMRLFIFSISYTHDFFKPG